MAMTSSRTLVMDVGAGHIAFGRFATGGGRLGLRDFAWETLAAGEASENLRSVLAAAAARGNFSGSVALGLPGHRTLTKFVVAPAVERAKRAKILRFEASQAIPYPLDDVVWDALVLGEAGGELDVMLAAARADAMTELCRDVESAGLAPERAEPGALALWHGFRYNHPELAGCALVVDIGARSTHLLFSEPAHFFVRTLPGLAGQSVTQAIADDLRIETAAAEALKLRVSADPAGSGDGSADASADAAVRRAAENFGRRLASEIARSIAGVCRRTGGALSATIHLTGGGAQLPGLSGILAQRLQRRVEHYDPLRRVDVAADAGDARVMASALAVLVGLAAPLATKPSAAVNLLPAALVARTAFRRRQPWWLASAALAAAALLPPIVHFHRVETEARTAAAAIEAQLRTVRALEKRNSANLARLAEAEKEIAALRGLIATKSGWVGFFADLQGRLVQIEDVWLDKLTLGRKSAIAASADGRTAPPLRLTLTGRLLDPENPLAKVSADSRARARRLLASFLDSPFVAAVEDERFDNTQPGLLRLDVTLVIDPRSPL
jgi:type IV pilus assembly protein PilM